MSGLNTNGSVVWITGLSDSGKTTVATILTQRLRQNGNSIIMLDGDQLRKIFGATKQHDRESRLKLASRYAGLCKILAAQGQRVVIATISMFREIHAWNRENIPGYFEVYLKTPMEELRRRDTKGIYQRFDSGELNNVYGLDFKADEPENPEILIEFDPHKTAEDVVAIIESNLKKYF